MGFSPCRTAIRQPAGRGDCRALDIQERHDANSARGPTARAIRFVIRAVEEMGRRSGTRATNHARQSHRAEPAEDFIGAATNLMTFPDRGLVIAVMANISFADTRSVALNIAQAFAAALPERQK